MKVYQTLLKVELYLHDAGLDRDGGAVLDRPDVVVVDDGCGGGTASVAVISLIAKYQSYRRERRLPIYPVEVNCLGVDTRDEALEIYGAFLRECRERVGRHLVQVESTSILPGSLSLNLAYLIEYLSHPRRHSVTVVLANLIRSLTREQCQAGRRREVFALVGLDQLLPDGWGTNIGAQEISVLAALLNGGLADVLVVPLISALVRRRDRGEEPRTRWAKQISAFQRSVKRKLGGTHQVLMRPVEACAVGLVYPTGSYHRKHSHLEHSDRIEYDSAFSVVINRSYAADSHWEQVLSHDNLLLAWARVRYALTSGPLDDGMELRLFDHDVEERLTRLRRDMLSYRWDRLAVSEMLEYAAPKGSEKEPRPMTLCRLEDQILAVALLQTRCTHSVLSHRRSYANRMVRGGKGEFLYEPWYEAHKSFLDEARETARRHPSYMVVMTDISSFYPNIPQPSLFRAAEQHLSLYRSRSAELARRLILRDLSTPKLRRGIPQGHLASGCMANLYLYPLDDHFAPGNQWGIEYFRYVDDMILLYPPNLGLDVVSQLDKVLRAVDPGLSRAAGKTFGPMTTSEFLEMSAPDLHLERLAREHRELLARVYRLGRDYLRLAMQDWWGFVELYGDLLRSVGLYLPAPWLSRKLHKNLRWGQRAANWGWPRRRARMPSVSGMSDLRDLGGWSAEFRALNSDQPEGWVCGRERLVASLSELLHSGLSAVESSSQVECGRAARRVRFASYRLGQAGFGSEAGTIRDVLVEQPWLVNPRSVSRHLALQGRGDLLLEALERLHGRDGPEWAYVRAVIVKAMGDLSMLPAEVRAALEEVAWAGSTTLERTMASEALIREREGGATADHVAREALPQIEDSYLRKNYVLLHALEGGDVQALGEDLTSPPIVHQALEYLRVAPDYGDLYRHEPDVLRMHFYEHEYPDDPEALEDFPY